MFLTLLLPLCVQVRMNGHTGWVRSMSSSGKYLFSCGCNYLRQWDQAYIVPKEVSSTKLFTGDILAIAANDKRVFTAGADGSLRCWTIGKGSGELAEAAVREKAHDGRITALVVRGSLLYSAGYDGTIKVGGGSAVHHSCGCAM
jgi:WD40 repeat protein